MNIKISKEQHEQLLKWQLGEPILMGSHMYGTNTETSDFDYLYFYNPPLSWNSLLPNVHQFQYTEGNIDYIWTTDVQFFKNLISGDSTINSDIMLFNKHRIEFFDDKFTLNALRTYKIIKAYIGFAKRDLKNYTKEKKLSYAYRGLYIAECLLDGTYPDINVIKECCVSNDTVPVEADFLIDLEKELRIRCNDMYDRDELKLYYIPPPTGDDLLDLLLNSNNTKEFTYA